MYDKLNRANKLSEGDHYSEVLEDGDSYVRRLCMRHGRVVIRAVTEFSSPSVVAYLRSRG